MVFPEMLELRKFRRMVKGNRVSRKSSGKTAGKGRSLKRFDAGYFKRTGAKILAGIDEAGRGCLAGPVVAAAVAVDATCYFEGLNDSKQLTVAQREALYPEICAGAPGVGIGWATAREVDRVNVLQATLLAAGRALEVLTVRPDLLLTDYLNLKGVSQPVEPLVKGDARSQAIAAASVVAKVTRDRWMRLLDAEYPEYGFASNKGYGAQVHRDALIEFGSSTAHRHTFRGVDWFDREYRISATLGRLLEEIERGELDPDGGDEIWRGRGHWLPECEREIFFRALNESRGAKSRTEREAVEIETAGLPDE